MKSTYVSERFAAYRRELGLAPELTPHGLRHSYVTHLVEDGFDPLFVQMQVGHRHASTTAIYTAVSGDFKQRALATRWRSNSHRREARDRPAARLRMAAAGADGRARDLQEQADLVALLAEHGIRLSDSQVWRMVTGKPERLNLHLLDGALQDPRLHPQRPDRARRAERRGRGSSAARRRRPARPRTDRPQARADPPTTPARWLNPHHPRPLSAGAADSRWRSRSATAPIAATYPQICRKLRVATCTLCGTERLCRFAGMAHPICRHCVPERTRECAACGKRRRVAARLGVGLVCGDCARYAARGRPRCKQCRRAQLPAAWVNGSPLCSRCAGTKYPIASCGALRRAENPLARTAVPALRAGRRA